MKQTTYQKLLKWLIYITPVAGATVVQIPSAVITDETKFIIGLAVSFTLAALTGLESIFFKAEKES